MADNAWNAENIAMPTIISALSARSASSDFQKAATWRNTQQRCTETLHRHDLNVTSATSVGVKTEFLKHNTRRTSTTIGLTRFNLTTHHFVGPWCVHVLKSIKQRPASKHGHANVQRSGGSDFNTTQKIADTKQRYSTNRRSASSPPRISAIFFAS